MLKMTVSGKLLVLASVGLAAVGCVTTEKSENPLSPTVAGPIAGVNITPPQPVEPSQGIRIAEGLQPLTLSLQNAVTTGVRPITYLFQIATDVDFANIVFSRDGIAPGANGVTSFRMPDALATGRSYYWRARAQDGANVGPFSHSMVFTIYTPVVLGKPTLVSPAVASTVAEHNPRFVIANVARSGPVGPVVYFIEVATNGALVAPIGSWVIGEQAGGQTVLRSPINLAPLTVYYWRAQAYEATVSGPWSDLGSFITPASVPTTPTGPTTGCTIPQATPLETLQCARAGYPHPMDAGHRGALMNQVAWAHRGEGYGMHLKTGGNLCPQPKTGTGISCDLLVHGPTGAVYDVLLDEEVPTWGYKGGINSMSNFVAPVQP